MKKIFSLVAGVSLLIFAASCEKKQPNTEVVPTAPDASYTIFSAVNATNYGTEYGDGQSYNYSLQFSTDYNYETDGEGNITYLTDGIDLYVDLYFSEDKISAGTYTVDTTGIAGTVGIEYSGAYKYTANSSEAQEVIFTDGSVKIEVSGNRYTYTINMITTDGDTLKGFYTGDMYIGGECLTPTTLSIEAPSDSVYAINYGDSYGMGSDDVVLQIWTDKAAVAFDINLENGATEIPVGTYSVDTTYAIGTLSEGYSFDFFGYTFPTGTYAETTDSYLYITSGKLVVTKVDNIYTLVANLKNTYGSTINATYTGAITVEVGETAPEAVPAKKIARSVKKAPRKQIKTRR
jgi:hypothetical protein